MEAKFVDIKAVFEENNLRLPKLNVLVPDSKLYEVLAIQPAGGIEVKDDFIGHADRAVAASKFSEFLRLGLEKNCDLLLSPEYSCPWDVLADAIATNSLPKMGKIWLLGCESITPDQLNQFTAAHDKVLWLHEPIHSETGEFLDVLAYVTKAQTIAGDVRDVITLQFKTHPMGGEDHFERDHLICGTIIYYWHNSDDVTRLVSFVCSEALGFDEAAGVECGLNVHPYVIVHPQLIIDPYRVDISAYRGLMFRRDVSKEIEVVTLNWARGFTLPKKKPSRYGGSAIYTKSPQFNAADTHLEANHQMGMFYAHWHTRRTDLCLLSFDEHVFRFRMPKIRQLGPAVSSQRTGPEMRSLYQWDVEKKAWLDSATADDGFATLCASFQNQSCDYCLSPSYKAVDRERLLTLSAGSLKASKDWHEVRKMPSYTAESDEHTKRLTFTHEEAPISIQFRQEHLARYIKLQTTILANPQNLPETVKDLSGDWDLVSPREADKFRFNLVSRSGHGHGATAIFVGFVPPHRARELADALIEAWGQLETRRLVVWYETQSSFGCVHPELPSIVDDSDTPTSFTRPNGP
jgi:hypothetical protein